MEMCQGESGCMLGKESSPENGGHGTDFPGQWSWPQVAGVHKVFGQQSQT